MARTFEFVLHFVRCDTSFFFQFFSLHDSVKQKNPNKHVEVTEAYGVMAANWACSSRSCINSGLRFAQSAISRIYLMKKKIILLMTIVYNNSMFNHRSKYA